MSHLAPNYQPASNFASAANTPALSATSSRESPTSVLKSPDLQPGQLVLGEGQAQAKQQQQLKEEQPLPECWGHRGASAAFPENTKASFIEACKAGADGIETDIHIAKDNVLVLFHDPELGRTTTGSGKIHEQPWAGVLEHVRTKQQPIQPIPKFTEVLDLLIAPGHGNVKLNIDCKVENEPTKLFSLMKEVIEQYPNWETVLAPRIILGIWHPKFIAPASTILPFLPRYAITMSIPEARTYFFKHVHGFSVRYEYLASAEGERFRKECAAAGKGLCCWTVNGREEMRNCARWGVKSVISDKPEVWREIKREILANRAKALQPTLQTLLLPYIKKANWWFDYEKQGRMETEYLEREGGRFAEVIVPDDVNLKIVRPSDMLPQF